MFGSFDAVFPARAGVEDDALVEPGVGGGRGAGRGDNPDAVGKKRNAKSSARVEVLADEEITVVQRSSGKSYDSLENERLGGGRRVVVVDELSQMEQVKYLIVFGLWLRDGDLFKWVVHLPWLPFDLLDHNR